MQDEFPIRRRWVLVAPALYPQDPQGHPDLYWNAADEDWSESLDEATEYAEAERDAVDLAAFDGEVQWRERQIG